MLKYILALIWALTNPSHNHVNCDPNTGQITTMDDDGDGDDGDGGDDTGGQTGNIPPIPPKPPKP